MAKFEVEVAFASPEQQVIIPLVVQSGCTAKLAILQSGILQQFPQIDLETAKVGVFSQAVKLDDELKAGDRVEIYRPLILDPKEARFKRVKQKRA